MEPRETEGLEFAELLERFKAKLELIPADLHEAMGWLYVNRQIQDQRKRIMNRMNQLSEGKRVFWGSVLSAEAMGPMAAVLGAAAEGIAAQEHEAELRVGRLMRHHPWYTDVAIPAAKGVGMSVGSGFITAAKIMWAYGSASRFATFGKIVRYSRLAPENGEAPKRKTGQRIRYNPQAWQALFDLSEVWNRLPESYWRKQWDQWKGVYASEHPDYPKGRIHNMARRKVLREFLRDLWELWMAWEEGRQEQRLTA